MRPDAHANIVRPTFLIVEAHRPTAQGLRRLLESRGFNVAEWSGQSDADLDVGIPEPAATCYLVAVGPDISSGITLIQRLRRTKLSAPIVAMAGWSAWTRRRELVAAGASTLLLKPFSPAQLDDCLNRLEAVDYNKFPSRPATRRATWSPSDFAVALGVSLAVGAVLALTIFLLQ